MEARAMPRKQPTKKAEAETTEDRRPKRHAQIIAFTPKHEAALKKIQSWYAFNNATDAVRFAIVRTWRRGRSMHKAGKMPAKQTGRSEIGDNKILTMYADDLERLAWLQYFYACDTRRETVLLAIEQEAANLVE